MVYLWDRRDRIELHLLPAYSPNTNPIERVWWLLRKQITRNHRCPNLEERQCAFLRRWVGQVTLYYDEDPIPQIGQPGIA